MPCRSSKEHILLFYATDDHFYFSSESFYLAVLSLTIFNNNYWTLIRVERLPISIRHGWSSTRYQMAF
jgi:hypothetical protein